MTALPSSVFGDSYPGIATGSPILQVICKIFQPEEQFCLSWLFDQPGVERDLVSSSNLTALSKFRGPPGEGKGIFVYLSIP
jgi:hypothetical protein